MTLQHIVLFSYPREPSAEDAAEIRSYIAEWPAAIPGIDALRFGADLTGARTRGYHFLLYMEFADADSLRAYQQHPVHQRFLAWVTDNDITPLAFDYHLSAETVLLPVDNDRQPATKE
jgi:hypothetical protein